jgi:hypothetical protein
MNKLFSELESTKCFTNLNAYNKIYSLILDCFFVLDNCNSDNKSVCGLISNTKQNCIFSVYTFFLINFIFSIYFWKLFLK